MTACSKVLRGTFPTLHLTVRSTDLPVICLDSASRDSLVRSISCLRAEGESKIKPTLKELMVATQVLWDLWYFVVALSVGGEYVTIYSPPYKLKEIHGYRGTATT